MSKSAWLANLNLRDRLLVWLGSCQARYESAAINHLRRWWPERAIRLELRDLQRSGSIELDALDRVRWRLTAQGRSEAKRARERAQKSQAA